MCACRFSADSWCASWRTDSATKYGQLRCIRDDASQHCGAAGAAHRDHSHWSLSLMSHWLFGRHILAAGSLLCNILLPHWHPLLSGDAREALQQLWSNILNAQLTLSLSLSDRELERKREREIFSYMYIQPDKLDC